MDRPQLAILNHLLNQRPEVRAQLEALSGRRVALHFPMVSVRAVVLPDGFFGQSDGPPEAEVRILVGALMKRMRGVAPAHEDIELSGDPDLALSLGRALEQMGWDVSEDASRLFGDVAAHRLGLMARMWWGVKGEVASRLIGSYVEYLREEAPLLASRAGVEAFNAEVDQLRDDVARAEKRLARLEAALLSSPKVAESAD